MITEKGKEYIAQNFGVNNCFALEEVVPCTVYTEGTPNERVLDTSTILFLLVTEVADWVSTAAGKFTLADLIAANDGSYISMMESLGIEAYCIAGEPPVIPPVVPPVIPPVTPPTVGLKDFEIVSPSVNCDSEKCYARFDLRNNSSSASVYIRVEIDGAPCYKRQVYILRGTTKPQVLSVSISDLSDGLHDLTIAVGKDRDTDKYKRAFRVGSIGPPTLTTAEIAAELGKRGPIDTAAVSTTVGKDKWYLVRGEWGGTWLSYVATDFIKSISLDIDVRNPPTQAADITLKANHNVVNELDRSWVLARLGELPYAAAPPTAPSLSAAEFVAEIKRRGTLDLARISMIPGDNKWFKFAGQLVYRMPGGVGGIVITNPGKSNMYAMFSKEGRTVTRVETNWAMARISELPFTAAPTPPVTAPVTPTEPPEQIKAWIVANYGDGTRVTSDGWRRLSDAEMANALAPLPSGYTKADITGGTISWAMDNPNWKTQTICGWISAIGLTNLTEDHGRYIYQLAKGRTSVSDRIYNLLSPKPSKPSAGFVTEDNGRGVFQYAKGRKATGNKITGCNF